MQVCFFCVAEREEVLSDCENLQWFHFLSQCLSPELSTLFLLDVVQKFRDINLNEPWLSPPIEFCVFSSHVSGAELEKCTVCDCAQRDSKYFENAHVPFCRKKSAHVTRGVSWIAPWYFDQPRRSSYPFVQCGDSTWKKSANSTLHALARNINTNDSRCCPAVRCTSCVKLAIWRFDRIWYSSHNITLVS